MTSARPESTSRPPGQSRTTATSVVGIGVATWAVAHGIDAFFATNATGSVVLQALAAELGAGRAGVMWTEAQSDRARTPGKRIAIGAGAGVAFAAALLLLALAAGGARVAPSGTASIFTLIVGAFVAVAGAVRDELLLRGVLLRAFSSTLPLALLFLLAGAVAAVAEPTFSVATATRFFAAIAFTALWRLDRGALMAVAANATLRLCLGPLLSGGALDVRAGQGTTAPLFFGADGLFSGAAAAALAALFAVVLALRSVRAYREAA